MNNTAAHQRLVDDLIYAFGSQKDVRVWIRVVGFDRLRKIHYGKNGETDLDGIWRMHPLLGIRIGIEAKTGEATLEDDQLTWRKMLVGFGGIHILARNVDQAIDDFEIAKKFRLAKFAGYL